MEKHYSILNERLFQNNRDMYDYLLLRVKLMSAIDGYEVVNVSKPGDKGTIVTLEKIENRRKLAIYTNKLKNQVSNYKKKKIKINMKF